MNKHHFNQFLKSIREGATILKGKAKPSRQFVVDEPDAKSIRKKLKLSQSQFASLIGVNLATLKNWEQGRRKPVGPARVLLKIADLHPEVLPEVTGV